MNVIVAAGGTGGHINPALAIADKLKSVFEDTNILFIGSPDGLEARLVKRAGYDFSPVKMAGIQRRISLKSIKRNVKAVYYYMNAGRQVKKIFDEFKPDLVIGTGGYVTGTVLKCAVKAGIKTAIHESNSLPGVSVKVLCDKVDLVMVGSEDALKHLKSCKKSVVTGNPLRGEIKLMTRQEARAELGLPDCMTVLSVGGSQGAVHINEAAAQLLQWEQKKGNINHIHGFGKHGHDTFNALLEKCGVDKDNPHFRIREYIDNMYVCMCAADLIVTRAGAMTLTELTAVGRASLLIPYPYAAENHQYYNALTLQKANAGRIIKDADLSGQKLIDEVNEFCNNPSLLELMGENAARLAEKNAADKILKELIDLCGLSAQ
ncbi:MAG: undecaprenyldiphospho-muramoylpentapeptide beta-N-acetylglucosaminyltransferase [Eubacterium sp.]|nr:undecaprenyldiphospho-muramoylpentapeptide beta-N-acetylglucosaminyltransferase [Eubacterium sp.]